MPSSEYRVSKLPGIFELNSQPIYSLQSQRVTSSLDPYYFSWKNLLLPLMGSTLFYLYFGQPKLELDVSKETWSDHNVCLLTFTGHGAKHDFYNPVMVLTLDGQQVRVDCKICGVPGRGDWDWTIEFVLNLYQADIFRQANNIGIFIHDSEEMAEGIQVTLNSQQRYNIQRFIAEYVEENPNLPLGASAPPRTYGSPTPNPDDSPTPQPTATPCYPREGPGPNPDEGSFNGASDYSVSVNGGWFSGHPSYNDYQLASQYLESGLPPFSTWENIQYSEQCPYCHGRRLMLDVHEDKTDGCYQCLFTFQDWTRATAYNFCYGDLEINLDGLTYKASCVKGGNMLMDPVKGWKVTYLIPWNLADRIRSSLTVHYTLVSFLNYARVMASPNGGQINAVQRFIVNYVEGNPLLPVGVVAQK